MTSNHQAQLMLLTSNSKKATNRDKKYDPEDQRCHLLEFPAELRNRIYEEALVHHVVLEIYPTGGPVENMDEWDRDERSWAHFRPSEPSLTKTCRQIRAEASPVFYGANIFGDTSYDPYCLKFISWLSPEKRMMLKSVRVRSGNKMAEKLAKNVLKLGEGVVDVRRRGQHFQPMGEDELKRGRESTSRVLLLEI